MGGKAFPSELEIFRNDKPEILSKWNVCSTTETPNRSTEPFNDLFENDVRPFIENKAQSLSTNCPDTSSQVFSPPHLLSAGITSTLVMGTQEKPLNIFAVFAGPPITGKWQAFKGRAASPLSVDLSCLQGSRFRNLRH